MSNGIPPLSAAGAAPRAASASHTRVGIMCGLLLLAALVFWPTTASIVVRWTDTLSRAYTHGSLIVLLSLYMLWRRREAIAREPAAPSIAGFALTVLLGLAWLFFYRGSVQIAHQVLLPLLWMSAIAAAFGFGMWRRVWLPVGFLYFTVPAWDVFVPLLQWISVYATRAALSVVGIPVYFDGLEFQIPAGRFQIADGCSGLHFFIVGLAIATFYGDLHDDHWRARLRLMLLAVAFALVANWTRIIVLIIVGHVTNMQHHLVATEHYSFGWGIFAATMVAYFFIVRRWPASPAAAEPPTRSVSRTPVTGVALAVFALAVPGAWLNFDANLADAPASPPAWTKTAAGWQKVEPPAWAPPHFEGVEHQQRVAYDSNAVSIDAYWGVYLRQSQGRELGGFSNHPIGPGLSARSVSHPDERWQEIAAVDTAGSPWLARVSYGIGQGPDERRFNDARRAQWAYGRASYFHDPLSSVIVLRARCATDCEAARAALSRFATLIDSTSP